jgi:small-conductance mechanosensitive channel
VLPDKEVDALYVEMGDSDIVLRVRSWIEPYRQKRRMITRVHTALKQALNEDGIEYSDPTQTLKLEVGVQASEQVSQALKAEAGAGGS